MCVCVYVYGHCSAAERARRAEEVERNKNIARLSLLDMDIEQDRGGAHMASSVAWGYGPALAMPTLMGMMGGQESTDLGPHEEGQVRQPKYGNTYRWAQCSPSLIMYGAMMGRILPYSIHI